MPYTNIKAKETVTHVESDTYSRGEKEIRIHVYKCKVCGSPMTWTAKPYERCPWCGFKIFLFDGRA